MRAVTNRTGSAVLHLNQHPSLQVSGQLILADKFDSQIFLRFDEDLSASHLQDFSVKTKSFFFSSLHDPAEELAVGCAVGFLIGSPVGAFVGTTMGLDVGSTVGLFVGATVGNFVGKKFVGFFDGGGVGVNPGTSDGAKH